MLRWPLRTLIYKSLIHTKKPHQAQFNNIYTDHECWIGSTDECKHNPENSSITKTDEHAPSGF